MSTLQNATCVLSKEGKHDTGERHAGGQLNDVRGVGGQRGSRRSRRASRGRCDDDGGVAGRGAGGGRGVDGDGAVAGSRGRRGRGDDRCDRRGVDGSDGRSRGRPGRSRGGPGRSIGRRRAAHRRAARLTGCGVGCGCGRGRRCAGGVDGGLGNGGRCCGGGGGSDRSLDLACDSTSVFAPAGHWR